MKKSTVSTILIVLAAVCVTLGWYTFNTFGVWLLAAALALAVCAAVISFRKK